MAVTLVDETKAQAMDLRRGDLVVQVNQEPVWQPKQLMARYQAAKAAGRKTLLLLVEGSAGFPFSLLPVR